MRFFRPVPRVAPAGPAAVEDLAGLYAVQWVTGDPEPPVAALLTPTAGDIAAWLAGGFEVYAASFDGRLVGAVRLAFATGACVVDMLTVAPDNRRRGIGGYLVEHATSRARRAGSLRVWTVVPESLQAVVGLLDDLGFGSQGIHTSPATGARYALRELVL